MFLHSVLTDNDNIALELVRRDFEIERRWSLTNSARGVVMRAVAGAVITAEITRVGDGHAA